MLFHNFVSEDIMKKVILTALLAVICFAASNIVSAQSTSTTAADKRVRVRIDVTGFDDNIQALQKITEYTRKKAGADWTLVRSNPELILRVHARVETIKSWRHVNKAAATRNALIEIGNDLSQAGLSKIPVNNRITAVLVGSGRNATNNQFELRKRVVETTMEKHRGTVELVLVDAKTGEIYAHGLGQNVIVVQRYDAYRYDGEPVVVLAEGDLRSVGIMPGVNLDGAMRQLLALSAYMNADLPESNIVDRD
jgi:hypothetical protein